MDYVSLLRGRPWQNLMLSVEVGNDLGLDPSTPLLQVVRNCLGVTGTKYACGIAKRGASNSVLDENNRISFQITVTNHCVNHIEINILDGVHF